MANSTQWPLFFTRCLCDTGKASVYDLFYTHCGWREVTGKNYIKLHGTLYLITTGL